MSRPAPLPHVLEYLLTELAHELKNPMVTIKTFAQHLDDLFGDAEARAHFRLLTEDAITRMDGLLENLLEFSRLPAPQPSLLELAPLVHEALETIRSDLVAKHVEIRLSIENGRVCADETHLRYALRNILRGVAEEIPPRTWLSVDLDAGGPLRLALPPPRGLAHRLATLISGDRGRKGTGAAPLGFVLAHSVVASNGGHVRIDTPDEGQMDVTITLPAAV